MERETKIESEIEELRRVAREEKPISWELALSILKNRELPLGALLEIAEIPRKRHFQNRVMIHVLNNVQNGLCEEDCGYCAQRKGAASGIPKYAIKSEEEILAEAKEAAESGAFRYCLVLSGSSAKDRVVERMEAVIPKIKEKYGMEVCLSAGSLTDPVKAERLRAAGLDRYNHNINTSENFYPEICTSHDYKERVETIQAMSDAGISLCSGVIVGMGEREEDIVQMAMDLKKYRVAAVPVNFFMPVPGHAIKSPGQLTPEFCLRVLSLFRLVLPAIEVRMAAGREIYLREREADGLRVANSLFVSGYLNVRGSNAKETLSMIYGNGYVPESDNAIFLSQSAQFLAKNVSESDGFLLKNDPKTDKNIEMKPLKELRPSKKGRI